MFTESDVHNTMLTMIFHARLLAQVVKCVAEFSLADHLSGGPRSPESVAEAAGLDREATHRLLRIYFIAEAKYDGELTKEVPWSGRVAWADKLKGADREKVLELLNLPEGTGPAEWCLTEFEDNWAYRVAPADVYFAKAADQATVKRPPIIEYVAADSSPDVMGCAIVALIVAGPAVRRFRRGRKG